jgi:hypothetical protein
MFQVLLGLEMWRKKVADEKIWGAQIWAGNIPPEDDWGKEDFPLELFLNQQ